MSKEFEALVERVAHYLQEHEGYASCLKWDEFDYDAQELFRDKARQILSDDSILIKADDQSLPEAYDRPDDDHYDIDFMNGVCCGQAQAFEDIQAYGWVKTADKKGEL